MFNHTGFKTYIMNNDIPFKKLSNCTPYTYT